MAERTTFQSSSQSSEADMMADAASQVRKDVEHLIEGFDVQMIMNRVEEFGRDNPVGLALTALTLGVAVGFLMRGPKKQLSVARTQM